MHPIKSSTFSQGFYLHTCFQIAFSLILLILPLWLGAQTESKIDSLQSILNSQSGKEKIGTLLELTKVQTKNDPTLGQEYARKAVTLAIENENDEALMEAYYLEGKAFRIKGNYPLSDSLLRKAESYIPSSSNTTLAIEIYIELGNVAIFQGKTDQAKHYFDLGLGRAEKINDYEMIGALYILETGINHRQYNLEGMETSLKKAGQAFKRGNNSKGQAIVFTNLANVYFMRGENDTAIQWYDSTRYISNARQDYTTYAITTVNKGNALLHLKRYEEAIVCANEALQISEEYGLQNSFVNANNLLADIWTSQSNFEKAMPFLEKALELSLEMKSNEQSIRLYESLGVNYFNLGDYQSAIDHYLKSFSLSDTLDFDLGKETAYRHIAKIYDITEEQDKALHYLNKSLALAKQHGDPYREGVIHLSKAESYSHNHSFQLAKAQFDTVFIKYDLAKRENDLHDPMIGMANLYLNEGILIEAKIWVDKCKEIPTPLNESNAARLNWIEGRLLINQKKYSSALNKLRSALKLAEKTNSPKIIMDCYISMTEAYTKTRDFENALRYTQLKQKQQDQLLSYRKTYDIKRLNTEFDSERKQQEIEMLEQDKLVSKLKSEQQEQSLKTNQYITLFLLLVLCLIISLGYLLFKRFRYRKKEEKLALEIRQIKLEKENMEKEMQLESAELQAKFFTDISHELRTPLTLIAGPLEGLVKTASEKDRNSLTLIHKNTQRLIGLVNQTLDLSKLQKGQLPLLLKAVNINQIVKRNVELFQLMAADKEINFKFSSDVVDKEAPFDADKIDLIVVNLLGNAFAHTQKGGEIRVSLSEKQQQIELIIQDSGSGIPKVEQEYIFQRFYQVENGTKNGSGIGLALTKELVDLHKGSITFESEVDQGTTFTVMLPIPMKSKEESQKSFTLAAPHAVVPEIKPEGDCKVLVVEDNLEIQAYITELLKPHYQVITANNGREGIELAEQHYPDLIVSDIMMPDIEGIQLTQHLKQNVLSSHIPIILLTAKSLHEDKIKGLQSGADDYLVKPFSPEELLVRINSLIVQRQKLRKLFSKNIFLPPNEITSNALDEAFLKKATESVEAHIFDQNYGVEQLSKDLALNRNSVYQKLKAITGLSPSYFIRSVRLKKAAYLLQNLEYSIIEVAELCGYNNRQAFNKAFKAQFEMTPSAYRKKQNEKNPPLS